MARPGLLVRVDLGSNPPCSATRKLADLTIWHVTNVPKHLMQLTLSQLLFVTPQASLNTSQHPVIDSFAIDYLLYIAGLTSPAKHCHDLLFIEVLDPVCRRCRVGSDLVTVVSSQPCSVTITHILDDAVVHKETTAT